MAGRNRGSKRRCERSIVAPRPAAVAASLAPGSSFDDLPGRSPRLSWRSSWMTGPTLEALRPPRYSRASPVQLRRLT